MKSLHTKLVLSALGFALLAGPAAAQQPTDQYLPDQYLPISTCPISTKWSFAATSWVPIPMHRFGPS
jgi:hypothetical protein